MADEALRLLKTLDQELNLKYNRFYISISKDNKSFNLVFFWTKKTSLGVEPKLKKAEEIEIMLDAAGLDLLKYDTQKHRRLLKEILGTAYRDFNGDISI